MERTYLPVLLLVGFVIVNAIGILALSHLLTRPRPTPVKQEAYESGIPVIGDARERFSVKFYLIAMIFILFDIEVIFLVPWAVVFRSLSGPAFGLGNLVYFEMLIFIVLLLAGYVYVIKKGAFDWSDRARREAEAQARLLADMENRHPGETRTAA